MMQCVTYNKSSSFAQKEEKTKFSNVFEVRKNNLFLYQMKKGQILRKTLFHSYQNKFQPPKYVLTGLQL
jgi:hypothetical protein